MKFSVLACRRGQIQLLLWPKQIYAEFPIKITGGLQSSPAQTLIFCSSHLTGLLLWKPL